MSSAAARPRACVLSRCAASCLCTRPLRGLAPVYSAAARPRRANALVPLGRYAASRLCTQPLRGLAPVHSAAARPRACVLGRCAASRLCTQPLRGLAPVYSAAARPRASALGRYAASRFINRHAQFFLIPQASRACVLGRCGDWLVFFALRILANKLVRRPVRALALPPTVSHSLAAHTVACGFLVALAAAQHPRLHWVLQHPRLRWVLHRALLIRAVIRAVGEVEKKG